MLRHAAVTTAVAHLLVLAAAIATTVTGAVVGPEVLFSDASILSGGLDMCPTYNASTCTHGIAAFAARRRALTAQGIKTLPLPTLQRTSVFTKMHPLDWGVNFDVLPKVGIKTVVSKSEFSTRHYAMSYQTHEEWQGIVDNFAFPMSHSIRRLFSGVYFDAETRVQVVPARLLVASIDAVARIVVDSLFGAKTLGNGYVVHSVVLVHDSTPENMLAAMRRANTALTKSVDLSPTVICRINAKAEAITRVNNTWLIDMTTTSKLLHRLRLHEDPADTAKVTDVSVIKESLLLPSSMVETDAYRRDQALLKIEHDKAIASNPYMGTIAAPMPPSVTAAEGNICMRRECEGGNLFADAIRNVTGTDIALFSGPWLVGSGWAAGKITLRDLYAVYPYTEQLAKGTYLGITLFELINHTIAAAAFDPRQSFNTVEAQHLMQVAGLKITYTFSRGRQDRLVSIDVLNRHTGQFEPLERLKYYTVSCDSFLGRSGIIMKQYLRDARYAGEVGMVLLNDDLHRSLGIYVRRLHGTYTPQLDGRLTNVSGLARTGIASMKHWDEKGNGCRAATIFNKTIGTCVACPGGTQPDAAGGDCVPIPGPPPLLSSEARMALIAVSVIIAVIGIASAGKGLSIWRRYQRLRYCPRDSETPIAAFFVTVRNEVALRERHPTAADETLRRIERIVVEAAPLYKCYVAKKLKAHFLVVAEEPSSAVLCAAAIYRSIEAELWEELTAHAAEDAVENLHQQRHRTLRHGRSSTGLPRSRAASARVSARTSPTGSVSSFQQKHIAGKKSSTAHMVSHSLACSTSDRSSVYCGTVTPRSGIIIPSVSIGIAFGKSRVEYDEEVDVYSYSGPVLDTAVTVADLAHGGQILATELVVVAAAAVGKIGTIVEFEEFMAKRMVCPLNGKEADVALSQVNVVSCRARIFEPKSSDSDEAAGALAAALETASGGLTARRIGVVAWTVPALRGGKGVFTSRTEHTKASEEIIATLRAICGDTDDLVSTADGVFTAVVNGAAARTAQVAASTVDLARAGMHALDDVTQLRAACGVSVGTSVAGTYADDIVIAGVVSERARLLATAAYNHPCEPGLLVSEEAVAELEGRYALAAVDVVSWPDHCGSGGVHGRRQGVNPGAVPVFVAEESTKAEDDEWLYQLEAAAHGNPHTLLNTELFAALGRLVQTNSVSTFKTVNSSHTSSPKLLPLDKQHDGPPPIHDRYNIRALVKRIGRFTSAPSIATPPLSFHSPTAGSSGRLPTLGSGADTPDMTVRSVEEDKTPAAEGPAPNSVEAFARQRTIELCFRFS